MQITLFDLKRVILVFSLVALGNARWLAAQELPSADLDRVRSFAASEINKVRNYEDSNGYSGGQIILEAVAVQGLGSLTLYRAYTFRGSDRSPILIGYDGHKPYALGGTKDPMVLEAYNTAVGGSEQSDPERWLWVAVIADPNGAVGVVLPCRSDSLLVKPENDITPAVDNCTGGEAVMGHRPGMRSHFAINVRSAVIGFYHYWEHWTLHVDLDEKGRLVKWRVTSQQNDRSGGDP